MSELEKLLKDVVKGSIGVVAVAMEKADGLAKALVEKGEETIRANQDTVDQLRDKLKEAKESVQNVGVDLEKLSREARDELRRQLDFLDDLDKRTDEEDASEEEIEAEGEVTETCEECADEAAEEAEEPAEEAPAEPAAPVAEEAAPVMDIPEKEAPACDPIIHSVPDADSVPVMDIPEKE